MAEKNYDDLIKEFSDYINKKTTKSLTKVDFRKANIIELLEQLINHSEFNLKKIYDLYEEVYSSQKLWETFTALTDTQKIKILGHKSIIDLDNKQFYHILYSLESENTHLQKEAIKTLFMNPYIYTDVKKIDIVMEKTKEFIKINPQLLEYIIKNSGKDEAMTTKILDTMGALYTGKDATKVSKDVYQNTMLIKNDKYKIFEFLIRNNAIDLEKLNKNGTIAFTLLKISKLIDTDPNSTHKEKNFSETIKNKLSINSNLTKNILEMDSLSTLEIYTAYKNKFELMFKEFPTFLIGTNNKNIDKDDIQQMIITNNFKNYPLLENIFSDINFSIKNMKNLNDVDTKIDSILTHHIISIINIQLDFIVKNYESFQNFSKINNSIKDKTGLIEKLISKRDVSVNMKHVVDFILNIDPRNYSTLYGLSDEFSQNITEDPDFNKLKVDFDVFKKLTMVRISFLIKKLTGNDIEIHNLKEIQNIDISHVDTNLIPEIKNGLKDIVEDLKEYAAFNEIFENILITLDKKHKEYLFTKVNELNGVEQNFIQSMSMKYARIFGKGLDYSLLNTHFDSHILLEKNDIDTLIVHLDKVTEDELDLMIRNL